MTRPVVHTHFDTATNTATHIVHDAISGRAAIVDPVLDFDMASGRTSTRSMDAVLAYVRDRGLAVDWILETHVHADHLSAATRIREAIGGRIGIGRRVREVQSTFKSVFNLAELDTDGSQFDQLFTDGDLFSVGDLAARVLETPGHTPACVAYLVGDAVFVGDTLFMPDFGTARTDFPGGSAAQLYDSVQALFALPGDTRMFLCHDYKAPGRDEFVWQTTVAEQRMNNVHIRDGISRDEFVATRERRDRELGMPALILPSIQVNVRAGALPEPEDNSVRYLKLPIDAI